jgi:hypothetical protein
LSSVKPCVLFPNHFFPFSQKLYPEPGIEKLVFGRLIYAFPCAAAAAKARAALKERVNGSIQTGQWPFLMPPFIMRPMQPMFDC